MFLPIPLPKPPLRLQVDSRRQQRVVAGVGEEQWQSAAVAHVVPGSLLPPAIFQITIDGVDDFARMDVPLPLPRLGRFQRPQQRIGKYVLLGLVPRSRSCNEPQPAAMR